MSNAAVMETFAESSTHSITALQGFNDVLKRDKRDEREQYQQRQHDLQQQSQPGACAAEPSTDQDEPTAKRRRKQWQQSKQSTKKDELLELQLQLRKAVIKTNEKNTPYNTKVAYGGKELEWNAR
jgi:hypothetical protein